MELLGVLASPLLPASSLLCFIISMLKENLFINHFQLASLVIMNVYFIGLTGLALPLFHFFWEIAELHFEEHDLKKGGRLIDAIYFCNSCASPLVLAAFYHYAEAELSQLDILAVKGIFGCCAVILLLHIYSLVFVSDNPSEMSIYKKRRFRNTAARTMALLIGMTLTSVLLGAA